MTILHYFFWLCIFGAVYSYIFYPFTLMLHRRNRGRDTEGSSQIVWPTVTIIIPVHNGADVIAGKIIATLALDYQSDLLEILVVSDGCSDMTDEIVESYASRGVRLVRSQRRRGKEEAQRMAIAQSNGEILVFTDVGTATPTESLKLLIAPFADSNIGATSSEDKFLDEEGCPKGEGVYIHYEMWLRRLESERATLVGLSGSYFAARRAVCADWNTDVPSDFNVAIECARNNLRAVSVSGAKGVYADVAEPTNEYRRKLRTVVRGMRGLLVKREVLNPLRYGFFAIQMWGHKVLRWAMPWCLIGVFLLSGALSKGNVLFLWFFIMQISVYILAVGPKLFPSLGEITPVRILYYIGTVNIAILHATFQVLIGRRITTWEPTKRQPRSSGRQD